MKYFDKDFFINLVFSAIIGFIVGIIQIMLNNVSTNIPYILFFSSVIGMVIGTISEFVYYYIYEIKQMGIKATLLAIFIVIALILYCLVILDVGFKEFPIESYLFSLIIVESLSMAYCLSYYVISIRYNKKLEAKKKQFLQKNNEDKY